MTSRITPITTTALRLPLVFATGALAILTLPGCIANDGEYATVEFVSRAVTESDLRKQRAREEAKKREEERLARKKARRAATEKAGWLALSELEKYRSTYCYSPKIEPLTAGLAGPTRTAVIVTKPLVGSSRSYGSGGGEGSGGDRGC